MFEREFNQLEHKPELILLSNEKNSTYWSEIHWWKLFIRQKKPFSARDWLLDRCWSLAVSLEGDMKRKKDSCRCELGSELQAGGRYWTIAQRQPQSCHVSDRSRLRVWRALKTNFSLFLFMPVTFMRLWTRGLLWYGKCLQRAILTQQGCWHQDSH